MLAAFILLVAGGLGVTTADRKSAQTLRNTNLANLSVWAYWAFFAVTIAGWRFPP